MTLSGGTRGVGTIIVGDTTVGNSMSDMSALFSVARAYG